MKQTPCEKLGYKVGDKFEVLVTYHSYFGKGEVVTLHEDDGTNIPYFYHPSGPKALLLNGVRKLGSTPEKQTPCEKLGYKVGDKFEVITDNHEVLKAGEVVELHVDDGSNVPYFVNDTSSAGIQAVFLTDVRRVDPTQPSEAPKVVDDALRYGTGVARAGDRFEIINAMDFAAEFAATPPSEYYDVYFRWTADSGLLVAKHVMKDDIGKYPNVDRTEPSTPRPPQRKHSHYFKDVRHLEEIDVYRVLELFEVRDSRVAHAVKKLLVSGARGTKDQEQDIQEALDTLLRRKEMLEEDGSRG